MTDYLNNPAWKFHLHRSITYFVHFGPILNPRNRHILIVDVVALSLLPALALAIRLDSLSWWSTQGHALAFFTTIALLVKLTTFYGCGLYRRYWRYASINAVTKIVVAVGLSTVILMLLFLFLQQFLTPYGLAIPRTVPIIDGMLCLLFVGGARIGIRAHYQWRRQFHRQVTGERVLIVGAGEAGTMIVREIHSSPQLNMELVAFVDDDPKKIGARSNGLPILGTIADIPNLAASYQIQRAIIAVPSAPLKRQQKIAAICQECGITADSMPGTYQLLAGYKTINRLPMVDTSLLLGRAPVKTDQAEVASALRDAVVLVTGAGGSIGSELCRQIAQMEPAQLILLGHGENSIFEIGLELRLAYPDLVIHSCIVDVRDRQRVDGAIETHRPKIILHAAAHKHVPFMEESVEEAVLNNVLGTQNVLRASEQHGVERFVLISSDKAVNPSSVMGATKRLAELLVQDTARRSGRAYMAVRFGNVLGSRGSVVPIFQRQIAAGGPLTITHPEMTRYFMTIPEAVQLVLQTTVLGSGSEVFLLDMGQPIAISDLAKQLLHLCGLQPGRDIDIVYSGIRPGEKLSEDLFLSGEDYRRTRQEKIFVANRESQFDTERLNQRIAELLEVIQSGQRETVIAQIQRIIPEYQPKGLARKAAVNRIPAISGENESTASSRESGKMSQPNRLSYEPA